jgi:uncharacterized protein (DUF1800 family)
MMTENEARHLLRRTGFGVSRKEVQSIVNRGRSRADVADRLLGFTPSKFKPGGRDFAAMHNKWVKHLTKTRNQLQEKLVLFWHDHFATHFAKVSEIRQLSLQNRLFRVNCRGNFKDLVKAVNKDPAMMEMLDTVRNTKGSPNENYARELLELFTLGVSDFAGNPNYLQEDVVQIARAFTGWTYDGEDVFLHANRHDFGSPKEIFPASGGFPGPQDITANGTGEGEIDEVIDIIFRHKDSDAKNTVARHITRKLIEYFAHPDPSTSYVDGVIQGSGFDVHFELTPLLKEIFVHDDFYLTAAGPPYTASSKKSVKWPVDYVVGTLRMLGMKLKSGEQYVDGGSEAPILDQLTNMGQTLFDPPSVFGWDWEEAWLSSSTLLARYGFARDVTTARNRGGSSFRPERLMDLSLTNPGAIVGAVLDVLGVPDQLSDGPGSERQVLINYLTDNGAVTAINLLDEQVRRKKLAGLFALVLQSPAYQLH